MHPQYPVRPAHMPYDGVQVSRARVRPNNKQVLEEWVQCTLHCLLYSVHYTGHSVQYTVHCVVCIVQYTVHCSDLVVRLS